VKTYAFKVVVEPDAERWHARCPSLEKQGAVTWGSTQQEALQHIQEVVEMILQEMREDGTPIPEGPTEDVEVFEEARVAVTL
jgi:predicted RNase H-like HicB family nuclease